MDERLHYTNLRFTSIRFLETQARQRIPRDITCSYSRVFYRQVSVHAAKKRRKIVNRRGESIGHRFSRETDPREERRGIDFSSRESAWYARRRIVKRRGLRRATNAICIQNEIVVYQNPSFTFYGGRAEKRGGRAIAASPSLLPLYGNLIIYLV